MVSSIVNALFTAFYVLILARVIFSWIRPSDYNSPIAKIGRAVQDITDPFMRPIERLVPPVGGLDFSPIIVLLLAQLLQRVILSLL